MLRNYLQFFLLSGNFFAFCMLRPIIIIIFLLIFQFSYRQLTGGRSRVQAKQRQWTFTAITFTWLSGLFVSHVHRILIFLASLLMLLWFYKHHHQWVTRCLSTFDLESALLKVFYMFSETSSTTCGTAGTHFGADITFFSGTVKPR